MPPQNNPFADVVERNRGATATPAGNPFADAAAIGREESNQSTVGAFSSSAARRFVNNLLSLPRSTGNMLASLSAGAAEGFATVTGRGDRSTYRERLEREQQKFPASLLRAIPAPTTDDITASVAAVPAVFPGGESPGEAYDRARGTITARRASEQEAHPIATAIGGVGGDVATLVTGRAPRVRARARAAREAPPPLDAANVLEEAARVERLNQPGLRKLIDDVVNSRLSGALMVGGRRVAETGLEGAMLAAMHEGDPMTSAAIAGGLQAGGSGFISMLSESTRLLPGKPLASLAISAGVAGSLYQMYQELTPWGRDRYLESTEAGHKKIVAAVALGLLSKFAGYGGASGNVARNLPVFVDAMQTMPRGAINSFIADMEAASERGDDTLQLVVGQLVEDPDYFGDEVQRRLNRALVTEDVGFDEELNRLMNDNWFRKKVDGIRDRLDREAEEAAAQGGAVGRMRGSRGRDEGEDE